MKKHLIIIFLILFVFLFCQNGLTAEKTDVMGEWKGEIDVSGQKLGIIINFWDSEIGLKGTIDIPVQGAINVPLKKIHISNNNIDFEVPQFPGNVKFQGEIKEEKITGDFYQFDSKYPFEIVLKDRKNNNVKNDKTINYAVGKYKIKEKDVKIPVNGGELAGTLAVPEGIEAKKAVILVAGSGPTDRNGNTPLIPVKINTLKEIAHYLSSKGIVTLRYDKRGIKGSSDLLSEATSFESLKNDLINAINYTHKNDFIDVNQVYVAGHSEGGLLSTMAAEQGAKLDGIILISSPGSSIAETLRKQISNAGEQFEEAGKEGVKEDMLIALNDLYQAIRKDKSFNIDDYDIPDQVKNIYLSFADQRKFAKGYLDIDPVKILKNVDKKVCIIQGTNDSRIETGAAKKLASVVPDERLDLNIIKGANHFLKRAQMGNFAPDKRIDKKILRTIFDFVNKK